jgi:hypothetical protein
VAEYVGNLCATNYWVKLGLMREEVAALKSIAGLFENPKNQTTGNALHILVTTALLHWDKLESHVFSDQKYCDAEGFAMVEQFRQAALRGKFPALKPDGRSAGSRKAKKAEHFFQVCLSRQDQAELRELAQAFGMDLRTFLFQAVLNHKLNYRELRATAKQHHLEPRQMFDLTTLCPGASRN